jgi:uncharacterized protein (TIGR04255 family)
MISLKSGYVAERLPIADIPAPIRQADQNLRFQPIIQLREKKGPNLIRIGEQAISFHVAGEKKYPGWDEFREPLKGVVENLFSNIANISVNRIGLRYINAIVQDRHFIKDIHELDFEVSVGGKKLTGPVNLNFNVLEGTTHVVTTRLAHGSFVQGTLPAKTSAVIDVEVSTANDFLVKNALDVMNWIEKAHIFEKTAFFALIPDAVQQQLVEN